VDEPINFRRGLVDGQTATVKVDVVHGERDSFAPPDAGVCERQHEDAALVIGQRSCEAEDLLVGQIPATLFSSLAWEVARTPSRVRRNSAIAYRDVEDPGEDPYRAEDDSG